MTVIFTDGAKKDLKKLDNPVRKKIVAYLEKVSKLEDPRSKGKALTSNLRGLWRYRVDDYRLICRIENEALIIFVLEVGHRKNIYDK